jgi:hypothetical protein
MLILMTTRFFASRVNARALLAALALALPVAAQAQAVYKCVDASGATLYTDTLRPNCKALDLPSSGTSTAIPGPARRGGAPARLAGGAVPSPATATPLDFPKVNTSQQRARDDGRREILNDELRSEENKLAELRREFNGGEPERQGNERNYAKYQERVAQLKDNIGRAEKNIDALKREIANVK